MTLRCKSIPERHEMIVKRVVPRIAVAIAAGALMASVSACASAVGDRPDTAVIPTTASTTLPPVSTGKDTCCCCPVCWCVPKG